MNNKNQTVKFDPITNEISILSEDDRVIFTIEILDGHSIKVRSGQMVKDEGVIYTEQLQILPFYSNEVQVSKLRYD